jgi:type I restriction enzyme S subunit
MSFEWKSFTELLAAIVDNRGRTCPVGDAGMPLIATNCIDPGSLYPRYETSRFVSEDTYRTWFRAHPLPGDILFVCKGSPGRTSLCPSPVDFCIAQDMVAVRADPTKIAPKYLFAALRSSLVQSQINNLHVGTMIPHFKKGDFGKLRIPVPDPDAQIEIGDFYFEVSTRIAILRETNATLGTIAQALFKSWFVDFDPVRAKQQGIAPAGMDEATAALFPDSFQDSTLGLMPKGWRGGTLNDLADLNSQSWSGRHHPERIRYLDLANVKDNEVAAVAEFAFDDAPSRARRVVRSGDTIVGTVRPGNRSYAFIHEPLPDLTASTGFAVLSPKVVDNTAFVYLAATQDISIEHLSHVADGGAYPAVRPDVVSALACVVPSDEILRTFNALTWPLLVKVSANQQQAETLATLRDSLLPRLISGQLRLPMAQEAIAEATHAD